MLLGRRNHRVAPVSKDERPPIPGFTRDRQSICASRVGPTCDVRDAAMRESATWCWRVRAPVSRGCLERSS